MGDDTRFVDYDAAFAELDEQAKPLTRRLFGRDWELPGVPPAAVVIRLSRLFAAGREAEDLSLGEMMALAADLIPAPVLNEWMDRGLQMEQLAIVIEDLIDAYGAQLAGDTTPGGGAVPEAEAPTTGTSTSSSPTGPSSKPTSLASTGSHFLER